MVEINKCGLLEMDEKKKIKICFAASSGGHYEQLMMLKPLMKKYDSFVITEKTDYSAESKGEKTYYMKQVNRREKDFIWRIFMLLIVRLVSSAMGNTIMAMLLEIAIGAFWYLSFSVIYFYRTKNELFLSIIAGLKRMIRK